MPDAMQEAHQQHGGHNAAPQQARQHVAAPADFLAQREERADGKAGGYLENGKAHGPGSCGAAKTERPASDRMTRPARWIAAGPAMASGQPLNPARSRPRRDRALRKPPSGAMTVSMITVAMVGVSMVRGRLASPIHGTEGHGHGKRQRDAVKDKCLA